ncbi:MAG: hypothetical protein M0Z93_01605 [Actinomycetota bacterium]|nr:hypothetical protein [Actinomycetota bacterium]
MPDPVTPPRATAATEPVPPVGGSGAAKVGRKDTSPVTTLRGAGVEVDGRRVGLLVLTVIGAAILVAALATAFAGYEKNSQVQALRTHGVGVEMTVTHCLGLMGGSGSNLVGYDCNGTYSFGGRRYRASIPGTADHAPGSSVRGVVDGNDPALFSTPTALGAERASPRVFVLPGALLVGALLIGGLVLLQRRRGTSAPGVLRRGQG